MSLGGYSRDGKARVFWGFADDKFRDCGISQNQRHKAVDIVVYFRGPGGVRGIIYNKVGSWLAPVSGSGGASFTVPVGITFTVSAAIKYRTFGGLFGHCEFVESDSITITDGGGTIGPPPKPPDDKPNPIIPDPTPIDPGRPPDLPPGAPWEPPPLDPDLTPPGIELSLGDGPAPTDPHPPDANKVLNAKLDGTVGGGYRREVVIGGDPLGPFALSGYSAITEPHYVTADGHPSFGVTYTGATRWKAPQSESSWYGDELEIPPGIPDAPLMLVYDACDQSVQMGITPQWNGGAEITGYQVGLKPLNGVETLHDYGTAINISIDNLITDTTYEFRLRAVNEHGRGYWSEVQLATPILPQRPAQPAPPTLTRDGNAVDGVIFPPDARCSPITGYAYRYRALGSATWLTTVIQPDADGLPVTTFRVTNLAPTATYEFQAQASNALGDSDWSASALFYPATVPSPPGTPSLHSFDVSDGKLQGIRQFYGEVPAGIALTEAITGAVWHIDKMYIASGAKLYSNNQPSALANFTLERTLTITPVALVSGATGVAIAANGATVNFVTGASTTALKSFTGNITGAFNLHGGLYIITSDNKLWSVDAATSVATALATTVPTGAAISDFSCAVLDGIAYGFAPAAGSNDAAIYTILPIGNAATVADAPQVNFAPAAGAIASFHSAPTLYPSDGAITFRIEYPLYTGGEPISSFGYRINPGSITGSADSIYFTHSGLTNGTAYQAQVTATNTVGTSAYSEAQDMTPADVTVPDAPALSNVAGGARKITGTITPADDDGGAVVLAFNIYYRTTGRGVWASQLVYTRDFTIQNLTNGQQYSVRAAAINAAGESDQSAIATATPADVPGKPIITLLTLTANSATLACTRPADNGAAITGYEWAYKLHTASVWTTGTEAQPRVTLTNLVTHSRYNVRVRAVNSAGNSAWSDTLDVYPSALPAAPTLVATAEGSDIRLTTSHTEVVPVTGYQWRYRATGTAAWTETLRQAQAQRVITGLTVGQSYDFQAQISTQAGDSPWSATVTATPQISLGAPPAPTLTAGDMSIAITVGAVAAPLTGRDYRYRAINTEDWMALTRQTAAGTLTIASLINGAEYEVQTRNVAGSTYTAWSASARATPFGAPGQPVFDFAADKDAIQLSNIRANANGRALNGMEVNWRQEGATDWQEADVPIFQSRYRITDLARATWQVRLRVTNGLWSIWSGIATVRIVNLPAAPTLAVTPGNAQLSILIAKTDTSTPLEYEYRYRLAGGLTWTDATTATPAATITGLVNGQPYQLQARLRASAGWSAWSAIVRATPAHVPSAPAITLEPRNRALLLRIQRPADNGSRVTGYDYEYRLVGGAWTRVFTTAQVALIGGLQNGLSYDVRARALNAIGSGEWSEPATGIPRAANVRAGFEATVNGLLITVQSTADGENLTYRYDFGDGTIVDGQADTRHSYAAVGTYIITQYVSNAMQSDQLSKAITISDAPTYIVILDLDRDNEYSNPLGNISGMVRQIEVQRGFNRGATVATPGSLRLVLEDTEGLFSQDRGMPPYNTARMIGMRVRVQFATPYVITDIVSMWIYRVKNDARKYGSQTILECRDLLDELRRADYKPPFSRQPLISDEIKRALLQTRVAYPYFDSGFVVGASRIGIDRLQDPNADFRIEESTQRLDWAGDWAGDARGIKVLNYITDIMYREYGGRFFSDKAGRLVFRNQRSESLLSSLETFDDDEYARVEALQAEVFNQYTATYFPRVIGSNNTTQIYENAELREQPIEIQPGETISFTAPYQDPNEQSLPIGAFEVHEPEPGADFLLNVGVGAPQARSEWYRMLFKPYGAYAEVSITNTRGIIGSYKIVDYSFGGQRNQRPQVVAQHIVQFGAQPPRPYVIDPNPYNLQVRREIHEETTPRKLYLREFRLRGRTLSSSEANEVSDFDIASLAEHGIREGQPLVLRYIATENEALKLIRVKLLRTAQPRAEYGGVVFDVGMFDAADTDIKSRLLGLDVGDIITVVNRVTGHSQEYAIERIQHSIGAREGRHLISLQLFGFGRISYFVIGASRVGGEHVIAP